MKTLEEDADSCSWRRVEVSVYTEYLHRAERIHSALSRIDAYLPSAPKSFNRSSWKKRNKSEHAPTGKAREQVERQFSIRYSELLRLPYFDVVRCHLVDPMHNLFLGTAKKLLCYGKTKVI